MNVGKVRGSVTRLSLACLHNVNVNILRLHMGHSEIF